MNVKSHSLENTTHLMNLEQTFSQLLQTSVVADIELLLVPFLLGPSVRSNHKVLINATKKHIQLNSRT